MKGGDRAYVPFTIFLLIVYSDFATYYSLGYKEIYLHHSHGVAISLWVLLTVCQLMIVSYWILILYLGPGKVPQIKPYDLYNTGSKHLTALPEYFVCDVNGYPIWCSNCESIKLARTHHTKTLNRCVPRMDHYCVYVGAVIGRDNYRSFMKFAQWFLAYFVALLGYLIKYTQACIDRGFNNNFIILYIGSSFWVIMLTALLGSHLFYIVGNRTTLDDMSVKRLAKGGKGDEDPLCRALKQRREKRKGSQSTNEGTELDKEHANQDVNGNKGKSPPSSPESQYINISKGDFRLVVPCSMTKWYDFGFRKNWINVWLYDSSTYFYDEDRYYSWGKFVESLVVFLVPFLELFYHSPGVDEVTLGPKFKKYLQERVEQRRCYLPVYSRVTEERNRSHQSHDE